MSLIGGPAQSVCPPMIRHEIAFGTIGDWKSFMCINDLDAFYAMQTLIRIVHRKEHCGWTVLLDADDIGARTIRYSPISHALSRIYGGRWRR